MKTARFADVVRQAGEPNTYQLWLDPKKDRTLQRAIADHRVMTIHQNNVGTQKDFGFAGFREEPHAQYLIFPKSVKAFADRRIVGINYALLAKESRPETRPKQSKAKPLSPATARRTKREVTPKKVVAFELPAEKPQTRRKAKTAKAPRSEPQIDPRALAELKKAMKELRAGKTVPAYERLAALVGQAQA